MPDSFNIARSRPLLQNAEFSKLFVEELGWEPSRQKVTLSVGHADFDLKAIAGKRGFTAWACECPDGKLPDHATRLKLDRKLAETSFEHLIVFVTTDGNRQSWMWMRREKGQPIVARTHEYQRSQPGDSLLQKLETLYVSLEEEESGDISTVGMAGRARAAFDVERVTKAFYRDFDAHRKSFLEFIGGFPPPTKVEGKKKFDPDQEWYASVMLNRLMFVYFIQRKGFLDGDRDYLRKRLELCKKEKGKDQFYSFYRYFLLRLFHEGFGKRRKDRAKNLEKLLGNIPYLNGGLFDVHELEKPERYGKEIQIPDKAFEAIFDYFDRYQWHLDERALHADNEINPDVLGYIFEKYINQKQMGAYYTKEDITEYIGKNTVIPFLFDAARAKCKVAFESTDGPTVWDLLRENPDRYIYPAVRHGAGLKLPKEIAAGLDVKKPDLIQRRKPWNKAAPPEFALPTETWREVVARRQRYEEVRDKLAVGDVREINDFITINLDLRQFAQDVIQNCEGPDLLMAFWQAISNITILDPTGGSGAFIFAALNILDPLYEGCLDHMEAFLAEWGENGKKAHPNYHKKFSEVLTRVAAHPNRRYFVLKSIILNNLYAVDIMEEAVEICKLRLFLKLASQVEPDHTKDNLGIEPLPDIDFNIRAGNTLVGYATAEEVRRCMKEFGGGQMKLLDEEEIGSFARFNTRCADVEQAFAKFRQLQTEGDGSVPHADKLELQKRLKTLEDELNRHLAGEYGVKASDKGAFGNWLKSHQPFHWFVEFHGIIVNNGGFDVVIGNPPYVEYSKVRKLYTLQKAYDNFTTNLYASCCFRVESLKRPNGYVSFIVPVSFPSTDRMQPLREALLKKHDVFHVSFSTRPSKLFEDAEQRLTIYIQTPSTNPRLISGGFLKWYSEERAHLFSLLEYVEAKPIISRNALWPKVRGNVEKQILEKIGMLPTLVGLGALAGGEVLYYKNTGIRYFNTVTLRPPKCWINGTATPSSRETHLSTSRDTKPIVHTTLLSSTFFCYYQFVSNCRDLNPSDVRFFLCAKVYSR